MDEHKIEQLIAGEHSSCGAGELFALRVLGDMMEPEFEHGAIIVVDPGGALFVPARGWLVLGASPDLAANGGAWVHWAWGAGWSLAQAQGQLVVRDAVGKIVDAVPFGSAAFPHPAHASIARVDAASDSTQASTWAASTSTYGPGGAGTPAGPNRDVAASPCLAGAPPVCDDGNPCTVDGCDAVAGCISLPLPNCCGNGVVESGEQCDGDDLSGATCASLGYGEGTLRCDADCTFDTAACTGAPACDPADPSLYTSALQSYVCTDAWGLTAVVSVNATQWIFVDNGGGTLGVQVPNNPDVPELIGSMPICPGGSFTATAIAYGECCEFYTLDATYLDANTWEGTFTIEFCGDPSCGCPTGDGGLTCSLTTCTTAVLGPFQAQR